MRRKLTAAAILALALAGGVFWWLSHRRWVADEPRREALAAAARFERELGSPTGTVREYVIVPGAYLARTPQEQEDFLRKALKDEVSPEGLEVLGREGEYGPLTEIFPAKGEKWVNQLGVNADACVAFRAERDGIRAELVLLVTNGSYRILRCNNVKQLAPPQ